MGPDELDNLLASIRSEGDEVPAGLDDLLENIRGGGQKKRPGGALALYTGTRGTDLVDEYIDERIIRILGLGQVFDIDYSTYLTLLKEKLVQIDIGAASIARDEQMLLQSEFSRVRGKVGRFKLNAKKVSAGAIVGTRPINVSKDKFFLTSSAVIPESPGVKKVSEDLTSIQESLDKILAEIREDNKQEKRQAELQRREELRTRRVNREKLLEKSQKKVAGIVSKLFTPVRGILDSIFRFIFFGLLGKAFGSFVDWFSDPKNKEKVDTMFRFLKDFWPGILGGLALFFTPLGGFVRGIIGILRRFTPLLSKLILKNPKVAALTLGTVAGIGGLKYLADRIGSDEEEVEPVPQYFNGGIVDTVPNIIRNITSSPINISNIGFASGGPIRQTSGIKITGAGPDTQLIAAQPGEFVISKRAVDTYGPKFFMDLNRSAGGTNIPNFSNGIQFASGGGMVGGLKGLPTSAEMVGESLRSKKMKPIVSDYGNVENTKQKIDPTPTRKIALPSAIFTKKDSKPEIPTPKSSAAPTSATISYSNQMLSPTQKITLPPEPPVRSMKPNLTMLPEIVRKSGGQTQMSGPSEASIPSFSAVQRNDSRMLNLSVYGIEGIG